MRRKLVPLCIGLLIVAYIISVETRLFWAHQVSAGTLWRVNTTEDRVFDLYRDLGKPLP